MSALNTLRQILMPKNFSKIQIRPSAAPEASGSNDLSPFILPLVFITLIRLWLSEAQSLWASYLPHDDVLFLNIAQSLASGNWLGDYNHLTLVKYPFYPAWIASSYHL